MGDAPRQAAKAEGGEGDKWGKRQHGQGQHDINGEKPDDEDDGHEKLIEHIEGKVDDLPKFFGVAGDAADDAP